MIVGPEQQTMVVMLLRHWALMVIAWRSRGWLFVLEQQRIVVVANEIESDFPVWWSLWILRRLSRVVRVIYQPLN